MSTGVVVGRFQTPDLHTAHMTLLDKLAVHRHKIILVGQSRADADARNPLPFPAIAEILQLHVPSAHVIPILDNRSDEIWSQNLDQMVSMVSGEPLSEATLYFGRESFIGHYKGGIKTWVELSESLDISATKIRKAIASSPRWDSQLFRMGVVWARMDDRPKVIPTVDVAIFKQTPGAASNILMGRKKDEKQFRLPGGFVDPLETLEIAVRRETREECGDIEIADIKFVQSFRVKDWRLRRSRNQILTSLFTALYCYGMPAAGDDIHELKWVPIQFVDLNDIVEEHHPLIHALHAKGLVCLPTWQRETRS